MQSATDKARELQPGPDLDALFFKTCRGWRFVVDAFESDQDGWHVGNSKVWNFASPPPVSTDATACESWVMRWLRENEIRIRCYDIDADGTEVTLLRKSNDAIWYPFVTKQGDDWKHALTRAAIAAKEAMKGERDGN